MNSGWVSSGTIHKAKPGTGLIQVGRKGHLVPISPYQHRPRDPGTSVLCRRAAALVADSCSA